MSKLALRVYACDCKVILGVDRLDYTKGLISRLKSFQRLLVKYPKWIGKVLLLQVAVPSRTDVQEYKELKEDIDKLVGCINGQFSTPAWSPIRFLTEIFHMILKYFLKIQGIFLVVSNKTSWQLSTETQQSV